MGKICWDFPLAGTGSETGSNIAAITMFRGAEDMDSLAREVCQNSLDARNKALDSDKPVKVKFELFKIKKKDYPDFFEGYEATVRNSYEYWKKNSLKTEETLSFLNSIIESLSNEYIPILVMSDYNTTGLRGVKAEEPDISYWKLLVDTEGISIKEDKSSAGSYGIGKNAPYAYSSLNLVVYNTLAVDGGRGFQGVTKLVTTTREVNGKMMRASSVGKYMFLLNELEGRPIYPEDNCKLASYSAFIREDNNYGTDVAIFGFNSNDYQDWEKLMAIAIMKNFPLAILNNRLEVIIKSDDIEYKINESTLEELLFDKHYDVPKLKSTQQIYRTITEGESKKIKIAEEGDLTLFVKYSKTYTQIISRFRSTGMLIKTTAEGLPHFSVVVVVNDVGNCELSTTLRKAEPPQHNEWHDKHIKDNPDMRKLARKYISSIKTEIQKLLDDYDPVESVEVVDGGVGAYLPDTESSLPGDGENDGLLKDIEIESIKTKDGRIIYSRDKTSAESTVGTHNIGKGHKTGISKKRKKKVKKSIKVTKPSTDNDNGVNTGSKKIMIITDDVDHRTSHLAGNKYRLFINCPQEYSNVFIQYYAARDNLNPDSNALVVKMIKVNDDNVIMLSKDIIGPIHLKQGNNQVIVEFENSEKMAYLPEFKLEVTSES